MILTYIYIMIGVAFAIRICNMLYIVLVTEEIEKLPERYREHAQKSIPEKQELFGDMHPAARSAIYAVTFIVVFIYETVTWPKTAYNLL